MSTHYADEQTTRGYSQHEQHQGGGWSGGHQPRRKREKPFFLTSEFLTMLALIAAVAIAGAVSDELDARRAWTLITVLGAAYIVSRGLSKIGRGDGHVDN
jgi:di/tricarboxylate transporter